MNQKGEDHMTLISQLYPGVYNQMVPQQGESKQRRRRKKNKGAAGEEPSVGGVRKRKLNAEQVTMLEMSFGNEHKLETERKDKLAAELGLDPRQVAVWFQNRRARWKNKKLEEEYNKLKNSHENVVVEKCRLETELFQLKEQLFEAEREIQRLAERVEGAPTNSPSSSLSVEANDAPFFGDFGVVDGYDNLFYPSENNYINEIDWMKFYI